MKIWIVFGVIVIAQVVSAQSNDDLAPVVIALQDIPRGFVLTEDFVFNAENPVVGIALYPASNIPATAITSLEDAVGKIARTDIPRESPIPGYFLIEDLRVNPNAERPFPVSPIDYRVTLPVGTYVEYALSDADVRYPLGLAAGDWVDVVFSTQSGNIVNEETTLLAQNVLISRIQIGEITLALPENETVATLLSSGVSLTLLQRGALDDFSSEILVAEDNRITWDYLTSRPQNPLVIPPGVNLSEVGN